MNNQNHSSDAQGYMLSVGASILFACIPLYMQSLTDVAGLTPLLHRVFWQFSVLLVLCLIARRAMLVTIIKDRRQFFAHLCTAPLIGVQWWLFIWAPVADRTMDLAIGYLILPVTLALAGVVIFSESVSKLKIAAIIAAIGGLIVELWASGSISWVSACVFVGYPFYFVIHRLFRTSSSFSTLCVESGLVMLAVFIWMSFSQDAVIVPASPEINVLLFGLGVLCLSGMLCYLSASKKLPLNSFGLLSYLEPVLLLLVAIIFLGESVQQQKILSYGCFAAAFMLVFCEGLRSFSVRR